ncbi:MAG: ankyrin repeat domain-containing protein [Deltaproteobacteria bacterium]|nr:ankyrin repeat domain-containing protein [Deltaproteobacteria bacterium]
MTLSPQEVLEAHGYFADLSPSSVEHFLHCCKDGPTAAVRASLDLGMPVDSQVEITRESALIKAAEGGSIERIELLLARGATLELRDSLGDTALRTALNWGHPDAARLLAQHGASLIAEDHYGRCALTMAISNGRDDHAQMLLELGAPPMFESKKIPGLSPMELVLQKRNGVVLKAMLAHGADPNMVVNAQGQRPLHRAVCGSAADLVALLCESGADPHLCDAHGTSAMAAALELGHEAVIDTIGGFALERSVEEQLRARALVFRCAMAGDFEGVLDALAEAELPIDVRNAECKTLLMLACEQGSLEGVTALLEAGAAVSVQGLYGATALSCTKGENARAIVMRLVARGARDVDAEGRLGLLPSAVWNQQVDIVDLLLSAIDGLAVSSWTKLMSSAVMQRNVALIDRLHRAGSPLDLQNEIGGETPLHMAVASYESPEVVAYLLAHGVDADLRDATAFTPLHKACSAHRDDSAMDVMRMLLAHGASLDALDKYSRTPFECCHAETRAALRHLVVDEPLAQGQTVASLAGAQSWGSLPIWLSAGRRDELLELLSLGVAFEPSPDVCSAPLMQAAIEAHDAALVRLLIARGADVHRRTHYGTNCVSHAAIAGSVELVEMLLDAGADPCVEDDFHVSAMHNAAAHAPVLEVLLARGHSPGLGRVGTPLLSAIGANAAASVALLLHAGASPNVCDPHKRQPIFMAISQANHDILRLLLDHNADLHQRALGSGDTPLIAAAKKGDGTAVAMLLGAGADPLEQDRDGENALGFIAQRRELRVQFAALLTQHGRVLGAPVLREPLARELTAPSAFFSAIYQGELQLVEALIAEGSEINQRDPWGVTALMHAIGAGRLDLARLLLEHGADPGLCDPAGANAAGYASFEDSAKCDALLSEFADEHTLATDVLNARAARALAAIETRRALESGELQKIAELLRAQKLHPYVTESGVSLAALAVTVGDSDLLDFVRQLGLSVHLTDLRQNNPLALAVGQGHYALADTLLEAGAEVDAVVGGHTLLARMLDGYNDEASCWLVEHGASPNVRAVNGQPLVLFAAQTGQGNVGQALIARGADVHVRDEDGGNVLHRAVENWWGSEPLAIAAVAKGAAVQCYDASDLSPLAVAVETGREEAAQFLLSHGAQWDALPEGADPERSARAIAELVGIDCATWGQPPRDEPA